MNKTKITYIEVIYVTWAVETLKPQKPDIVITVQTLEGNQIKPRVYFDDGKIPVLEDVAVISLPFISLGLLPMGTIFFFF